MWSSINSMKNNEPFIWSSAQKSLSILDKIKAAQHIDIDKINISIRKRSQSNINQNESPDNLKY